MKLMIVESLGKVKKIREIFDDNWNVAASADHIRNLPGKDIGSYRT